MPSTGPRDADTVVPVRVTRLLAADDAAPLGELVRGNRTFLAPWQPLRSERYYTDEGQRDSVDAALRQHEARTSLPLVILDRQDRVVGTITLQSVIRGAFQSCSVGYRLAEDAQGQGLASQALAEAVGLAFHDLRLHRVQAETVPHNDRSQRVLDRVGFVRYGVAPAYLKIGGRWQDSVLYQLLTPTPERVEVD